MDIQLGININKKLENSTQTISTALPASNYEYVIIAPGEGYMGHINSVVINMPKVASSGGTGNHSLTLYNVGIGSYATSITVSAAYTSDLTIAGLTCTGGTPIPADVAAFAHILQSVKFDNTNYLLISYYNGSNLSQTATRTYGVQYVKTKEGEF